MSEKDKDSENKKFSEEKTDNTIENNYNITDKENTQDMLSIDEEIKMRQKLRQMKYKKSGRKKAIKIFIFLLFVLLCVALAAFYFLSGKTLKSAEYIENYLNKNLYNKEIYIDGEKKIILIPPLYENEDVYIPLSFVFINLGHNILYDYEDKILSIATELEVAKFTYGEKFYYINGKKIDFNKSPFIYKDNEVYISGEIIEKFYPVNINFSKKHNTLIIENTEKERAKGKIIKEEILSDENKNSLNIKTVEGDYITIYEETDKTAKISTSDGIVGYISIDNIEDKTSVPPSEKPSVKNQTLSVKGKPVILFDQITNMTANYNSIKTGIPSEADVLVPTWFSFNETTGGTDGKIISIANEDYVTNAHQKGRKVWGLITDNFNSKVSRSIVKSAKSRENVINQIISYAKQYSLDGINIDFENIPSDSMREFTQFLRELSASLNNINLTLSIDVYIPRPWTSYYNREEFGEIVDYFIVMGYDQHTDGSETSGSVATKKWSEDSITLTTKLGVPTEKLLLGIPFYTRIWKENNDGSIETRAYGMIDGKKAMTDKGAIFKWNTDDGQNYAEITYNNAVYKMWLEDEKSVEERLKLVKKYDIAGIAAWRKGFEKEEVWHTIKKYMKG